MAFMMVPKDEAVLDETVGPDGDTRTYLRYFGKFSGRGPHPERGPQAYVVQLHNRVLEAHFHPVDQFQILLAGPASRYQRHEFGAMMVLYADAYSPYGPLSGGDPPMRFFTLRAEPSDFIAYVPKERDKLAWLGRRSYHHKFEHLSSSELPERGMTRIDAMVERDEDGLEALTILAGPGARITVPGTERTNGQFVFVADGWVEFAGKVCGFESLAWQDPDEGPVELIAGSEGVRVFVMRYPSPSTVVQHDESEKVAASA